MIKDANWNEKHDEITRRVDKLDDDKKFKTCTVFAEKEFFIFESVGEGDSSGIGTALYNLGKLQEKIEAIENDLAKLNLEKDGYNISLDSGKKSLLDEIIQDVSNEFDSISDGGGL